MIKKLGYNIASKSMNWCFYELELLGNSRWLDQKRNLENPAWNGQTLQWRKERGAAKGRFVRSLEALLGRHNWTSTADMGIQDYEAILRVIYSHPEIPQWVQSMFSTCYHYR